MVASATQAGLQRTYPRLGDHVQHVVSTATLPIVIHGHYAPQGVGARL